MRYLIIVRHGRYDGEYLTPVGVFEMKALRDRLRPILDDQRVRVFCSPASRAVRSARIIIDPEVPIVVPDLLSGDDEMIASDVLLALLDRISLETDVAIMVTHFEVTRDFPAIFGAERLDIQGWPCAGLGMSQAYLIDCEEKRLSLILPKPK